MGTKRTPAVPKLTAEPVTQRAIGGGLEGAESTARELLRWQPPIISPDRQINPVKEMADARSRDAIQNDGYALGALYTHRDSIVGGQYRLNAQPDFQALGADEGWSEEFQSVVESRFNLVADSPSNWLDASGQNSFTGLIRLAVGGFLMTGEVLGTAEWLRGSQRPCGTAFQMISPSRLSNPDGAMDTKFLRRGVYRDFFGRAEAYSIRAAHPGDMFIDDRMFEWKRIEAAKPWGRPQVLHIIEQIQPDQTRGVADMVSVLKEMRMTKKFQEVVLQNAVVNATYAGAIETELPKDMVFGTLGGNNDMDQMLGNYMKGLTAYVGATDNIALDGAKIPHLYPGTKLNVRNLGTPGGVGTGYEQSLLRHVSAALGLSYEQFSRDYTQTNYSSARASMSETWKFMQARKKSVADRLATLIYALWLEEEINAGNIPLPRGMKPTDFYKPMNREAFIACDWIGASRGQIDEMKETQAAVLRINSGLSTYESESARLGQDFRRVFRQRAREAKLMKELGLNFDSSAMKPGANMAQQTMRGKNNTDEDDEL